MTHLVSAIDRRARIWEIREAASRTLAQPYCCEEDSGPSDCPAARKALELLVTLCKVLERSDE